MSSKNNTRTEQVKSYDAWVEYVDPQGVITEEEFERMSSKEKIEIIEKCSRPGMSQATVPSRRMQRGERRENKQ